MTKTLGLFGAVAVAATAMALSGCGGGGGGGGGGAGLSGPCSGYCVGPARPISSALATSVAAKVKTGPGINATSSAIARPADPNNPPQGSEPTLAASSVLTTAPFKSGSSSSYERLDVKYVDNSPAEYTIRYHVDQKGSDGDYSTDSGGNRILDKANSVFITTDSEEAGTDHNGYDIVHVSPTRDTVGGVQRDRISLDRDDDTAAEIVIYTKFNSTPDYLAAGLWTTTNAQGDQQTTAFTYGKSEYLNWHLEILSTGSNKLGKVSYGGFAGGQRVSGGQVRDFTTTVSLTANFDSSLDDPGTDYFGTIEGSVALGGGETLKLKQTGIYDFNIEGGPYFGDTQLVRNGADVAGFVGKWGGQFFGRRDAKGPSKTAGVFGAANTGNTESILGVYIADRK